MTAFISSLSEFAALLFNTLRLPALLPAMVFMAGNALLVLPKLSDTRLGNLYHNLSDIERLLCILLGTVLLTYFLDTINYSLIRWLEGYPWVNSWIGKLLRAQHCERHRQLRSIHEIVRYSQSPPISTAREQTQAPNTEAIVESLRVEEFVLGYPAEESSVLPTRFGNIIAAAEDYPFEVYKINAVALWPLLAPILTKSGYARFIEYEKAALDFALNSLVLSLVLGGEIIFCSVLNPEYWLYIAAQGLGVFLIALILHELSLKGALGWGTTIRVSYDLHREQLRKAANLQPFEDFDEELTSWQRLSHFVAHRDNTIAVGEKALFQYPVPENQNEPFSITTNKHQ